MRFFLFLALLIGYIWGDSKLIDSNETEKEFYISESKANQVMNIDEFAQRVEKNSINLAKSKAMTQSLVYEGRVQKAWNTSYIDADISPVKSPSGGTQIQSTIMLMLTPRLPWVTHTLRQSYKNKILRQEKSYELTKRLALISAKRLYLDYLMLKEQYQIYIDRYHNARDQLKISQAQYEAGRISKSQYLFFKSDFLDTKYALKTSHVEMISVLNALKVVLGVTDDSDIMVNDLVFTYLDFDDNTLESALAQNLYLEIVALDIKDYQYSARATSRSRFDSFEIGGGFAKSETSENIQFSFKIPIPLTTKYGNQRAMYLALQSGSIRESEILKDSLSMNAKSYLKQLFYKKEAIALAKDNEDNKRELSEIAKIGYEAGKTSAFEYLSVKSDHLSAMIATTQAKRDYINTLAMLEETLSSVLNLHTSLAYNKE